MFWIVVVLINMRINVETHHVVQKNSFLLSKVTNSIRVNSTIEVILCRFLSDSSPNLTNYAQNSLRRKIMNANWVVSVHVQARLVFWNT